MDEVVSNIVNLIKRHNNYDQAADLMIQNSFTISYLTKKTLKLSQLELAKLADKILQKK